LGVSGFAGGERRRNNGKSFRTIGRGKKGGIPELWGEIHKKRVLFKRETEKIEETVLSTFKSGEFF